MQLERIRLKLRRRTAWEALDLGQAMLRAGAGPAYRAWLATFGLAGLLSFALFWQWPWVAVLVLWWIKPLCDRVILLSFSRSLFGAEMSWRDVWRSIPTALRAPGVLSGLTIRRLSLARSFLLPVWLLENQSGAAARSRMKLLARRSRGGAVWLTFLCANMLNILSLSFLLLLAFMAPIGSEGLIDWDQFLGKSESTLLNAALGHGLWMLAEAVIEPLYVASGFSLYLNRRSELEGWDIDVGFRRLNERHAAAQAGEPGRIVAGLAALALCAVLLMHPPPLQAQPASGQTSGQVGAPAQAEPSPAKKAIEEILRDPVFGRQVKDTEWRLRETEKDEEKAPRPAWLKTLQRVIEAIAGISRVLVWVGAALLVAALIYVLIRYRDRWLPGQRVPAHPPEFLFGLDVRPESLPDDVAATARAAIAAGRIEAALSLLYRAALVALIHRLHIEFRIGDTEADCLQRVDQRLSPPAQVHFKALLDHWRAAAYAHRLPETAACEALCADWERYFGQRGAA